MTRKKSRHSSRQDDIAEFEIEEYKRNSGFYKKKLSHRLDENNNQQPFTSTFKKHSCTDILCMLLFLVFIAGLILVSLVAYKYGNPSDLVLPHDSRGRVCGKSPGVETKPYLLFFDITKCLAPITPLTGCPTEQVCVSECPSKTVVKLKDLDEKFCDPFTRKCPTYLLESRPLFSRCVPSILAKLVNQTMNIVAFDEATQQNVTISSYDGSNLTFKKLNEAVKYLTNFLDLKNFFELALEDFTKSYWLILSGLGVGAVLALFWIIILRLIIKPVVYLTILIVLALLGVGTYFAVVEYLNLRSNQASSTSSNLNDDEFKIKIEKLYDLNYLRNLKETWLALAIIQSIIFLVLFLIIIFIRSRIDLACALIKEASKAIISMPASFFWPIVPIIAQIGIIVYCVSIALFLASAGIPLFKIVDTNVTNSTSFNNDTELVLKQIISSVNARSMVFSEEIETVYLQYLSDYKNEFTVGVYCDKKTFEGYKEKHPNTTLDCYFYR
jgi:choline transporter-like protein 2/4/5